MSEIPGQSAEKTSSADTWHVDPETHARLAKLADVTFEHFLNARLTDDPPWALEQQPDVEGRAR